MINEHDIADMCALYELNKGDSFTINYDKVDESIGHIPANKSDVFLFDHIDGMYSYCKDMAGNVVHFAAWTKVIKT